MKFNDFIRHNANRIKELWGAGSSPIDIADALGVSLAVINKAIKYLGLK